MLKKVLVALVIAIAVLFAVAAMQPSEFRIVRSSTITAPQADVYAYVNDFHNWEAWSPWAKLDPEAKVTYSGPENGVGAGYAWSGNTDVGEGRMTITDSLPHESIKIRLEFTKPMEATNMTEFSFKDENGQTVVTWAMSGHNNFVSKLFCLFIDMDEMVGGDFEKGLASMKREVEGAAAAAKTQVEG